MPGELHSCRRLVKQKAATLIQLSNCSLPGSTWRPPQGQIVTEKSPKKAAGRCSRMSGQSGMELLSFPDFRRIWDGNCSRNLRKTGKNRTRGNSPRPSPSQPCAPRTLLDLFRSSTPASGRLVRKRRKIRVVCCLVASQCEPKLRPLRLTRKHGLTRRLSNGIANMKGAHAGTWRLEGSLQQHPAQR